MEKERLLFINSVKEEFKIKGCARRQIFNAYLFSGRQERRQGEIRGERGQGGKVGQ